MKELSIGGMSIAPGVVETIISVAMSEVEGVTAVGMTAVNGLVATISGKGSAQGIDVDVNEAGELTVDIHVEVAYGKPLPEIAAGIRQAVYDAVTSQIGIPVGKVDVYVDGVQFKN
jgi:uncharacterized alkaline shock family protein YloU